MAVYSLKTVQIIPASLDTVWDFFSNPENLQTITPPQMKFTVISKHHGSRMYAGQIIEYNVRPILGIPMYWMTEITQVVDKTYFIDEQKIGPYSLWHHQHHFKAVDQGVEMTDIVHYKLPLWILGDVAQQMFVKAELLKIFGYRFQKTVDVFGAIPLQKNQVIIN